MSMKSSFCLKMYLIPSEGRGRRIFVSSRPAWSTRASSRTGSKATEKPCLEKQKQRSKKCTGQWWCTPLIPALRRQRQADLCEFEASLVYKSQFQDRLQSYRETLSRKTKQNKMSSGDVAFLNWRGGQTALDGGGKAKSCLFLLLFLETGFLCSFGACPGTCSCKPHLPQTHSDLLASASLVLGLKACATTTWLFFFFQVCFLT